VTVTTRFGTFDATDADVIDFVTPLSGFETCKRYLLLSSPQIAPFACLHGLDAPQPSFLAIDARRVDAAFDCALTDADRQRLRIVGDEALAWLGIVTVDALDATANLRAPIVINPARMLGAQLIPLESVYSIDHPLATG